MRTEESVTAMKAAAICAPDSMEPTRITLAGSAQTMPVMNMTCPTGIFASAVKAAKPTKESIRMMAGKLKRPRMPRRNQWICEWGSGSAVMNISCDKRKPGSLLPGRYDA